MIARWPWRWLSETRDTGGGDYAEGNVDKRAGAFAGAGGSGTGGAGGGGGSATVTVNLERRVEEPPQTLRDYIKSLWLLTLADQLERRERQAEVDAHQAEAERHRQRVMIWLWLLSGATLANMALNALWIWQWWQRFGWFW